MNVKRYDPLKYQGKDDTAASATQPHPTSNINQSEMTLNSDPTVTISVDLFTVSLLLASLLFAFCLVLAKRKYFFLRRVSGCQLDTKKLLILSAATACFLRIMSFIGVIAMDIANVRAHYSLAPVSSHRSEEQTTVIDQNQSFYDSAMTVLFDLPNAIVISTCELH